MKNISTEDLINYCFRKKKSLTPSRTLIIKTLSKYSKPKSAYELHAELNKNSASKINISTVYRVLEFWIELGLIHKISSLNKFLLCLAPNEKHTHMLNICTKCEKVIETCNEKMGLNFKKGTEELNLNFNSSNTVEIPVTCSKCS